MDNNHMTDGRGNAPGDLTTPSVIRNLSPAYFAMVMATGIVSISASLLGMRAIGWCLFGVNIIAYMTLAVLTVLRLICYPVAF
ncbi:MAG: hypothetical protein KGQ94_07520, partial [Alphaproteobacteria bacterium]|nr:hypothetical protein [Alphaproteobacteria bacterium]